MKSIRISLWMMLGVMALVPACLVVGAARAASGVEIVGAAHYADQPFPEYMHLWQEGWSLKDESGEKLIYARPDMRLGGYLFVYYRNDGKDPIKVTDLTIEGVKLSEALAATDKPEQPEDKFGSSILLSKLPKDQIEALKAAGTPVWWKAEPREVPPGGMGEVVVRLRRSPSTGKPLAAPDTVRVGIVTDKGTAEAVVIEGLIQARFESINFSPDLRTVYLYPVHPKSGLKPKKFYLDGRDVTGASSIGWDKSLGVSPIVVKVSQPLDWMAYHNFKVTYSDGSEAMAGIRAWGREMVYGMWGASLRGGDSSENLARRYLTDWAEHGINVHMGMSSGPGHDFFSSDEGWDFCQSIGIGRMTTWDVGKHDPVYFFLMDEPDAHDVGTDGIPATERLGSLGQYLVKWAEILRRHGPRTPILLNIDNTYKPENWYMYHQLPDIPCVDPYYPEQLDQAYRSHPSQLAAHTKPTYVQAVSAISQSSCRPKPLHVILCSTRYQDDKGYEGRYPTPEEKRMEVYYALGAGAKGLSYWWFSPDSYCVGCGKDEPAAKALWKEIGLLGAEVRTAGPVIARSSPAALDVTAPRLLWVRTLISGIDTAAIIAVNDDVLCDRVGTVVQPIANARVGVEMPSWISPKDAFEVTFEGIKDVAWKADGQKVSLDLGTVNVSRFILITSDPALRSALKTRYDTMFASNVAELLGEEGS